jgi:hypothetical protein
LLGEEGKEKEKKRKKERKEKQPGAFFPGPEPDTPCWSARQDFGGCYMQLKADLMVSL